MQNYNTVTRAITRDCPHCGLTMYGGIPILNEIREFHEKFQIAYDGPPRDLRLVDPKLQAFRRKFITEEFIEFIRAEAKEAAEDELDGCVDMVYVILGYCYLRGWDFFGAFLTVHEKNMEKMRVAPDDPRARSPWDVIKPPGWTPPDLSAFVR